MGWTRSVGWLRLARGGCVAVVVVVEASETEEDCGLSVLVSCRVLVLLICSCEQRITAPCASAIALIAHE